ncbi:MAG TPA: winged helix DNA-binding domain-containing protein [Solirubrobacterales bacterium]
MSERATLVQRFAAQALSGPPLSDPVAVAERLLAVQAQDGRGARLAVRARTSGLVAADIDRSLTEDRTLLISWLNRCTLHLVRSEDYPWLHALTTPPLLKANARRLSQEGVTLEAADRGVVTIERALAELGPLTRTQLREHLDSAGVRTEGQALVHILMLATLRGIAIRGPMVGREHAYALVRDWLGEPGSVDREAALAELARRYLAGHAPADDRDLARWAGLPLRDVRTGLAAIGSELGQGDDGLLRLSGRAAGAEEMPPPRLLGPFDPVLLGWVSREAILGSLRDRVVSGGLFRAFALVDGRAAGLWKWTKNEVSLDLSARLASEARAALEAEAADVARFLGGGS